MDGHFGCVRDHWGRRVQRRRIRSGDAKHLSGVAIGILGADEGGDLEGRKLGEET